MERERVRKEMVGERQREKKRNGRGEHDGATDRE